MRFSYGLCSFRRCHTHSALYNIWRWNLLQRQNWAFNWWILQTHNRGKDISKNISSKCPGLYRRISSCRKGKHSNCYNMPFYCFKWCSQLCKNGSTAGYGRLSGCKNHSNQFSVHICCRRSFSIWSNPYEPR